MVVYGPFRRIAIDRDAILRELGFEFPSGAVGLIVRN